ncbi:sigma factor [Sphingomonas sp. RIT328]|uniref:sigma factor n=1 Tax=Sphingomonas sp. RIT328 TaxID=1470591 RepID=UPI00045113B7|nr:sigma factor [Sphingomonas sp. RIT328]EZP48690.1 Sigma-70 region 2 [Sphingomonas sp. RIT328]
MSKTTLALESAVADVIAHRPKQGERASARSRYEEDKAFLRIMKLIAPRVRHFIRQYGLVAHWDDAEQACAIGVHRAIQAYDPEKAQFTTFVNWQIRGELQSLRFRLMTDQRISAQKVHATTVSLHLSTVGPEGEETTLESLIQDDVAQIEVEMRASDYLARKTLTTLVDGYIDQLRHIGEEQILRRPRPKRRPADAYGRKVLNWAEGLEPEIEALKQRLERDRKIIEQRLLDPDPDAAAEAAGVSKERARQISKRAIRKIGETAARAMK